MIYISKPSEIPLKLRDSQKEFDNVIQKFGDFNNIPEELKEKLLNSYKHNDIKDPLFNCSHNKCAYCETKSYGGYLEVDHFAPKKLYPKLSLKWSNLLPSCKECNINKSTHDTILEPIINPCEVNPEPYFIYEFLSIYPSETAPDIELAERTIRVCNLNRPKLVKARMEILEELTNYERTIENFVQTLNESNTERQKQKWLQNLTDSLEVIENCTSETEQYSGLCRFFLGRSKYFKKAKKNS